MGNKILESDIIIIQMALLNLIITYIWFGATVPEKYLTSLENKTYPIQILLNPPNNYTYKKDIQKADRYRLDHLRNGGVYSDFDTYFYYDCLMKICSQFRGELLTMGFGEEAGWKLKVANAFLYVPADNTSLIREITDNEGHNCTEDVSTCNGNHMLQKYRSRIGIQDLGGCLGHNFDFSWGQESPNKVLSKALAKQLTPQELELAKYERVSAEQFMKRKLQKIKKEEEEKLLERKKQADRFQKLQKSNELYKRDLAAEKGAAVMTLVIIIAYVSIMVIIEVWRKGLNKMPVQHMQLMDESKSATTIVK